MASEKFLITCFEGLTDNEGDEQELTLAQLFDAFGNEADTFDDELPLWSGATFNGTRGRDNVESVSILVLDVDGVTPEQHVEVVEELKREKIIFLLHSTKRSTDEVRRFRILLPLHAPVSREAYGKLWDTWGAKLGLSSLEVGGKKALDSSKRGAESMFFVPNKDERFFWEEQREGNLVGSSAFGSGLRERLNKKGGRSYEDVVREETNKLKGVSDGEKDRALLRAAESLAFFSVNESGGLDEDTIATLLLDALKENTRVTVEDWAHARKTVANGCAYGAGNAERYSGEVKEKQQKAAALVVDDPSFFGVAQKKVEKAIKDLRASLRVDNSNTAAVAHCAKVSGGYIHALNAEHTKRLIAAEAVRSALIISQPELDALIDRNVDEGRKNPKGLREAWQTRLAKNSDGIGWANSENNVTVMLTEYPGQENNIWQCVRTGNKYWVKETFWKPRSIDGQVVESDQDDLALVMREKLNLTEVRGATVWRKLVNVATNNQRDYFVDYLESLVPKSDKDDYTLLKSFFSRSFRGENSEYLQHVSCYVLSAAVRRTFNPGAVFQLCPVLYGKGGRGKSLLFRILCDADAESSRSVLVVDNISDISSNDTARKLTQAVFAEMAELESFRKADIEKVKAFITEASSWTNVKYKEDLADRKRRAIIFSTTNDLQFMSDRRILPIRIMGDKELDVAWVRQNRDQLWAEAVRWVEDGMPKWFSASDADRLQKPELVATDLTDVYEDTIKAMLSGEDREKWAFKGGGLRDADEVSVTILEGQFDTNYGPGPRFVTIAQVLEFAEMRPDLQHRVVKILRKEGWVPKQKKVGKRNIGVWEADSER